MSTVDGSVEENGACLSIKCKSCNVNFTPSTILKHINHPRNSCQIAYTSEEINQFKEKTIKWKRANQKKSYDPAKRRNNHLRRKLSTKCRVCNRGVSKTTALKHLNESKNCKKHYTEEELSVIEEFTNEPKSIEIKKYQRKSYDPAKRRKNHLRRQLSTNCRFCYKVVSKTTALKHLNDSKICKKRYTEEELSVVEEFTNESKSIEIKKYEIDYNKRKSYEPAKRRNNHLRRKLSTKCRVCNRGVSKTTALKHLNESKNCKKHYTEEELRVIEEFTDEPKSIEIKKYDYNQRKSYDPDKRRNNHLRRILSTKCRSCNSGVSKTTALKHLNDFKNCKKHYTEEELSVIEEFTNESKSIEIKKYEYDANARSKKYRDTNEYDSRKYDPEKRRQKHLQDQEKHAEELAKYQKQLAEKKSSELRLYLLEKFERHARERNLHEMKKSNNNLKSALEIIGDKLTEEMKDIIKVIRIKYELLYKNFEVEINETSAKANKLQSLKEDTFYLNLYINRPHRTSLDGRFIPDLAYSNRLYHTWQDERTNNLKTFKKIAQDLNIFYDWSPFDSSGSFTKCDYCKICHPGIYTRRCYCNLTSCILCKLHEAK